MPRPAAQSGPGSAAALFLISAVGLYLELLLIRWVSTEIRIFAYLQNTVLVVCFLGLGMGCWDSRKPFALRDLLVPLLALVALLALPPTRILLGSRISELLSGTGDLVIWGGRDAAGSLRFLKPLLGTAIFFGLMILLWHIFVPIGRLLGRLMNDHPHTIRAYSVNVAGSLLGIWLFVAASALDLPPVAWFTPFALGCLFLPGKRTGIDCGLLAAILGFAWLAGHEPGWRETTWSPYQKLSLMDFRDEQTQPPSFWKSLNGQRKPPITDMGTYFLAVNNIGYQAMLNLTPEYLAENPEKFPAEQRGFSQYDVPLLLHPNPKKVLIVGAGSGNDVAGALRNGATEVVAVEIDPAIIALGRRFHPEQPYADQRVRVVNDDARSYFATCKEQFDVIIFGLLDSHTTTAMTNARLDHYVYTRESLAHAKTLLADGGLTVLSFEVQRPWIADRMASCLGEVYSQKPMVMRIDANHFGWGGILFVAGDLAATRKQMSDNPKLDAWMTAWQAAMPFKLTGQTEIATDDWPYIYLSSRQIPMLYFLLAAALVALFFYGVKMIKTPQIIAGWGRSQTHFALLGAAFMLLEVQNISKAAVVLGNTWIVNAVIISGILCMILLANGLAVVWKKLPLPLVYAALLASCLGMYFLDLSRFGFLPYASKALLIGLLTSLPMLFSGIAFIRSFAATDAKDAALGANLMGSLVGGLLQSATFVIGIKALLLIVAAFYLLAFLTRPRFQAATSTEAAIPATSAASAM